MASAIGLYIVDLGALDGAARLGAALVVAREIGEAARVLGDAAGLAGISPRLTAELRAARAGMQPWQGTPAVRTLDEQLATCGLVPD